MIATTRGALIRDTDATDDRDTFGDEVESNAATVRGAEDFPLALTEVADRTFDQTSGTWRTVTRYVGRVPATVPVDEGDRIRDLRDGVVYAVIEFVSTPRSIAGRSSVTMNLRRTAP